MVFGADAHFHYVFSGDFRPLVHIIEGSKSKIVASEVASCPCSHKEAFYLTSVLYRERFAILYLTGHLLLAVRGLDSTDFFPVKMRY